jgi:anti-anti-sigma factor
VASRVDIVRSDVNGITWIALDGELDMARANEAGPELMAVCDGAAHAVLDTRALRFIDLAGLRLLCALWQRQRARRTPVDRPRPAGPAPCRARRDDGTAPGRIDPR